MYALKRAGNFTLDELWRMTPRQMAAWLFIADKHRSTEDKALLALHATAAQGDAKTIKKLLKDDS